MSPGSENLRNLALDYRNLFKISIMQQIVSLSIVISVTEVVSRFERCELNDGYKTNLH